MVWISYNLGREDGVAAEAMQAKLLTGRLAASANWRLAHKHEPIQLAQLRREGRGVTPNLLIPENVEDAHPDLIGLDPERDPVVLRVRIKACAEVEGPAITVKARRGVGMDFG